MVWGGRTRRSRPSGGGQNPAAPTTPARRPSALAAAAASQPPLLTADSLRPPHPPRARILPPSGAAGTPRRRRSCREGRHGSPHGRQVPVHGPRPPPSSPPAHAGSADRAPATLTTQRSPGRQQVWTTGARWPAGSAGAGVGDGRQGHAGTVFCAYGIQGQRCVVQAALRAAGQAGAPAASSRPRDDGLVALATPAPSPFL